MTAMPPPSAPDAVAKVLEKHLGRKKKNLIVILTMWILSCHVYDAGKLPEKLRQPQDDVTGTDPERLYLFAYHKATGYRAVLPVPLQDQIEAERVKEIAQSLIGEPFRLAIEKRSRI